MSEIKILYVEDEVFLAKIVTETLESRGYNIEHVADGQLAIGVYKKWKPDLCILDIMLPNKDGYSIAQGIRSTDQSTPILFLTAKEQTEDVLKGFKMGGNDYIKKPFSLEELIARIENLISLSCQNKRSAHLIEYDLGGAIFITQSMELVYADKSIKLSHRESEILKLLCAHKNMTLDRKKILLDVWNDDSFYNSRNLDVYIKKLRLHLSSARAKITTLKGVGYYFSISED